MTIQEIKQLQESENRVEFKKAENQYAYNSKRRSVIGYVVALANEGGGKLIFGVKENKSGPHEITGSTAWEGKEGKLEEDIYRDKQIRVRTEVLFEDAKRVLIIHIPARPVGKALKFEDVPLMRMGEDLLPMSDEKLFSILQEQEPDFSAKICEGLSLEDLDPQAIVNMKTAYARKQQNAAFLALKTEQVLRDLRLLDGNRLNYAALILLAKTAAIETYLPHAKTIWEFRFLDNQVHYDFRETVFEPLFTGIETIWKLVNGKNASIPVHSGAYIFQVSTFNEVVIREAILNAIAHRDYTIGSDVVIKQYPKKIVMQNPGGFPKGVTMDNIVLINSTPRSRLMAEVLEKTGLVERSGQGVDKIFSITLSEGKPLPSYADSDAYQVTLKLDGNVIDQAFSIYLDQVQAARAPEHRLGVEEIITLHKIRLGEFAQLKPEIIQRLQNENFIVKGSGQTNRYLLSELYYKLDNEAQRIGTHYVIAELQQFLMAIQLKALSIGELETALADSLNRNQIKYLINKLYRDQIIVSEGVGRGTRYLLHESLRQLAGDSLISEVIKRLRQLHQAR